MTRLRVQSLSETPIDAIPIRYAAGGGRAAVAELALTEARASALPEELDALLITGDLQGVATDDRLRLAGEALAERYLELAGAGIVPPADRVGVVLAGDLYSDPTATIRGASGDVRRVWEAFAFDFAFVAGVLGNHDSLGEPREERALLALARVHVLDGALTSLGGLSIAGVSGVIGNPKKLNRKREEDYVGSLRRLVAQAPDVVVLHESPSAGPRQRGSDAIAGALRRTGESLVVSGHCYWPEPLAWIGENQVLNVDGRAILLRP